MAKSGGKNIIIVKKVVKGHGGHHGGAWKVAYADFVTAMMALFIVLWLLNTSKPVKEAVAGYFRDPSGTGEKHGTTMDGTGETVVIHRDNMLQLKDELEKAMKHMDNFDKLKSHVEMTITSEGLRFELLESASGTFFDSGNPTPNASGKELLITLAKELGGLPNKISVEGHTDSKPFAKSGNYGNWELSTDRSNSARRLLQANGLRPDQVTQVRGFADQRLRKPNDPLDPANRRISLIVQYVPNDNAGEKSTGEGKAPGETSPEGAPGPSATEGKAPETNSAEPKADANKKPTPAVH